MVEFFAADAKKRQVRKPGDSVPAKLQEQPTKNRSNESNAQAASMVDVSARTVADHPARHGRNGVQERV